MRPIVLVTGASGFIGRAVSADLACRGFEVRAASRTGEAPHGNFITPVRLPDIGAPFDARPLVEGANAIVHLAGLAHADAAMREPDFQAINAEASWRLAEAARQTGAAKFVLISSVRAQSGPSSDAVLTEALTPSPTDAYGRSKLAAEAAVSGELSGSPTHWVALRPVLVYGRGVKGNMAALVGLARSGLPLPFAGLSARRSALSLANLASAIAHMLAPGRADGIYLVADDDAVTIPEIVAACRDGLGMPRRIFGLPDAVLKAALAATGRGNAVDRLFGNLIVDTGKLKAMGWRPVDHSLSALMAAMANQAWH